MKLKIEYVPIDSIKPYAGNAKLHPQEQIDQIKRSIIAMSENEGDPLSGFKDPIAIWKNGEVIEGHGRLLAAQQLEMDTVPIIRLDDLTDEQRRAYALIHNKVTMNSGFDMEVLTLELAEIHTFDMESFDFSMYNQSPESLYVDGFFQRGNEAKKTEPVFGCKVICETQEAAEELCEDLKEKGYEVTLL